jgi:hypothetical protein
MPDDAATVRREWASTPPSMAKMPENTSIAAAAATANAAFLCKPKWFFPPRDGDGPSFSMPVYLVMKISP